MNIDEIKVIVDAILTKKQAASRLEELKSVVDNRTMSDGLIPITVENQTFEVEAFELKKLIDKRVIAQDTSEYEILLKQKAK